MPQRYVFQVRDNITDCVDCLELRQSIVLGRVRWIMAIVLTNGKKYIAHDRVGAVIKVTDIEQAQDFYSLERAINQKRKTPGKCAGYYYIDTESKAYKRGIKRKAYSKEERKIIYNKSGGRCELCGQRLLFEDITLDHIVPLSMGGEDSMENLQAVCYACNQFKSNILPDDFMDRIIKIFLYQTENKCSKDMKLRIIHKLVEAL